MWRSVFKNVVGDVLGNDFEFEADQGYFISVNQNSTWVPTIVLAAPKKTVSLPPVLAMTDVTSLLAFSAGSLSSASAAFAFRSDGIGQGYVEYGTDLNLADRQVVATENPSQTHLLRLKRLTPNTKYYARIKVIGLDKKLVTSPIIDFRTTLPGTGQPRVVYGQILDIDGRPKGRELVMVEVDQALPMLAISDQDGNWHLDLGNLKDAQGQAFKSQSQQAVKVTILGDNNPSLVNRLSTAAIQNVGQIRFSQDIVGQVKQ